MIVYVLTKTFKTAKASPFDFYFFLRMRMRCSLLGNAFCLVLSCPDIYRIIVRFVIKMLGVQSRKRTLDGSAKPLVLGTLRVPWKMELGAKVLV